MPTVYNPVENGAVMVGRDLVHRPGDIKHLCHGRLVRLQRVMLPWPHAWKLAPERTVGNHCRAPVGAARVLQQEAVVVEQLRML
eukprot:CAMPEP_0184388836 /NCGR_PEP_ID=MMETSP0007-20130409/11972_1 /TAXON_ID=97485 /ORGANISM="Prymnesium parvum, Strain Texoma1" /LENGTH=83 /DNA_ID=CAMNT_0026737879 /DNA_START=72 /DNA_END=320 /DNA_ORIENTATION=-